MKPKKGIEKCPHCGGQNGFTTRIIFDCFRFTTWSGDDVDTDDYKVKSETNPKCMDCGVSVRSFMDKN